MLLTEKSVLLKEEKLLRDRLKDEKNEKNEKVNSDKKYKIETRKVITSNSS